MEFHPVFTLDFRAALTLPTLIDFEKDSRTQEAVGFSGWIDERFGEGGVPIAQANECTCDCIISAGALAPDRLRAQTRYPYPHALRSPEEPARLLERSR